MTWDPNWASYMFQQLMCKRKFDMLERPTEITEVKSQNWAESIQCNSMHFFLNVMFAVFLVSWFRCESGGKEEKHSFCGVALRPALDYIKSPQIWLPVIIRFLFMFMIYKMIGQCVSENLFSNTSWPTCGMGLRPWHLQLMRRRWAHTRWFLGCG